MRIAARGLYDTGGWQPAWLPLFRRARRVYLALDRDVTDRAIALARTFGTRGRVLIPWRPSGRRAISTTDCGWAGIGSIVPDRFPQFRHRAVVREMHGAHAEPRRGGNVVRSIVDEERLRGLDVEPREAQPVDLRVRFHALDFARNDHCVKPSLEQAVAADVLGELHAHIGKHRRPNAPLPHVPHEIPDLVAIPHPGIAIALGEPIEERPLAGLAGRRPSERNTRRQ